jgi:DNA polymerase I-like protein with 3'-5' exonuclease and polymerase domains
MSANIMKDVIPEVDEFTAMLDGNVLMTIHDELLLELPCDNCTDKNIAKIKEIMESPGRKIDVPLVVNHQIMYKSWGEKK